MVPILDPERHWQCLSCGHQHVTHTPQVVTPLHQCQSHHGLDVPYTEVPRGRAELRRHEGRHVVNEREDYVGRELPRYLNGRPIMNLVTERPDGSNDVRVFAPTALSRMA